MGFSKMRQRLGYGAADMASNLIWPMICTYLTVYYTDALLLDTAAVGLITLASKFIDAITDVLMGIVVDKTELKSGKCRPYFLIGALPLAFFAILTFLLPSFVSNDKVLMILFAFITFNLVSTCYTIVNTPLSAILPSLSSDQKERNVLVTFRMVMAAVGSFCVTFFALPLINSFGGKKDLFSYAWAVGIFSIGAVLLLVFSYANTREVVKPIKEDKIKLKDGIKAINGQYILFVITMFIYLLGFAVKQAGVFYYYNYYIGDIGSLKVEEIISIQALVTSLSMVAGQLTIPFFCKIMGKKKSAILMNFIALAGNVIFIFCGANLIWLCVGTVFVWFPLGYLMGIRFALLADVVEYCELRSGIRAAGILSSLDSFLAKLAFGFNVTVMLGLMEIGGYDANSDIQTETEKLFIQMGFVGVPIVCIIVTIILLLFFKFDKELPKMKAERESKLEAAK
ncbi:MAG: glycoside-pentoside-hexuronide (GPH):cation symporter [Oscillospiraceae bacterium]|nr:glycoside-pentoside-hexuronide (GPH):cation symporter [Oscillospiraceae bacterium]